MPHILECRFYSETIPLAWLILASFYSSHLHAGTLVPTYGTYFGGTGQETGIVIVTDSAGDVIIAGTTISQSLPGIR